MKQIMSPCIYFSQMSINRTFGRNDVVVGAVEIESGGLGGAAGGGEGLIGQLGEAQNLRGRLHRVLHVFILDRRLQASVTYSRRQLVNSNNNNNIKNGRYVFDRRRLRHRVILEGLGLLGGRLEFGEDVGHCRRSLVGVEARKSSRNVRRSEKSSRPRDTD